MDELPSNKNVIWTINLVKIFFWPSDQKHTRTRGRIHVFVRENFVQKEKAEVTANFAGLSVVFFVLKKLGDLRERQLVLQVESCSLEPKRTQCVLRMRTANAPRFHQERADRERA